MITFEEERYLIEYAKCVSYYFNKNIDMIMSSTLNIRTCTDKSILGNNVFNIINLYLYNIIEKYKDMAEIKRQIVLNILHEMSHISQNINYIEYNKNRFYRDMKEKENWYNVYKFIYTNIYRIQEDLNVVLNYDIIQANTVYYGQYDTYKKFTLEEYYLNCIHVVLSNDSNSKIHQNIDASLILDNVDFELDGAMFILKIDGVTDSNVEPFNNAIARYNNMTNIRSSSHIVYKENVCTIVSSVEMKYNVIHRA